jgi:hypothetical protein
MSGCLVILLVSVILMMWTCSIALNKLSPFSLQERIMNPLARFSGFVNNLPYDSADNLNLERRDAPVDKKKFNDDFIYNGGYLEQNLQLEHFDNSDYYNYDPVDNGGVDFNTIDSHMKFAEKLSKDHNKNREANLEFQETPYVKTIATALFRPNLA